MKKRLFVSFKTFLVSDLKIIDNSLGLTHYTRHYILVDASQSKTQQFYTLFHELVHVLLYKIVPAKVGWKLDGLWDYLDFLVDVTSFKENYRLILRAGHNLTTAFGAYLKRYEKRFRKYGYRRNVK